jgi:uncharacterized coiled-coil protein SlyX
LKGKCPSCLIKELKFKLSDEKKKRVTAERRARQSEQKIALQKKTIARLHKEIKTSRKRVHRMSSYAKVRVFHLQMKLIKIITEFYTVISSV